MRLPLSPRLRHKTALLGAVCLAAVALTGCSSDEAKADDDTPNDGPIAAPSPLYAADKRAGPWQPAQALEPAVTPVRRGMLDVRGIIHSHSPYSHDACDGKGIDEQGNFNEACLVNLREDLCKVRHGFLMLTDHPAHFREYPYPDVLLYRKDRGDVLIERGGVATANNAGCPDGHHQLIMAGFESSEAMPVGLEGHVPGGLEARTKAYGTKSAQAYDALRARGAVVLAAHTEDWSQEELDTLPLDGFEMYNLHQNMMQRMKDAAKIIPVIMDKDKSPQPDLVLLALIFEDPIYLDRWGTTLAHGLQRVTTLGTDVHRNSLNIKMVDGERVDSFRRMMIWFSNHLLVTPEADGSWDDRHLKAALKQGRLYGAFELLGYPDGFDFAALVGGEQAEKTHEMGGRVSLAQGVRLFVRMPHLARPDPSDPAPQLRARLLRARVGGFEEVAAGQGDLTWTVTAPGAYRAEIRMVPRHLARHLVSMQDLADQEFVWIYSNPIYVDP